jgi:hypothetical protein
MTRASQHVPAAAASDVSQSVARCGQANPCTCLAPAPEWPSAKCILIGGVLSIMIWVALAWWLS